MPEIPECLHRRYRALDQLISELSAIPSQKSQECFEYRDSHDPGIKLMCDFWNILKEDPECNLSQAVKQRMGLEVRDSRGVFPRRVTCYMAGRDGRYNDRRKKDPVNRIRDICCGSDSSHRTPMCRTSSARQRTPDMPLNKALCNLKEAASYDKRCNIRLAELMEAQKELKAQIQTLELREKEGVAMLNEADCLWACMEDEYKTKIAQTLERQKELVKELKEVEKSNTKWRKSKKDLDEQMKSVVKSRQEITEKTLQKKNDLKVIDMELADFNKRVDNNKRLSDGSKQVLSKKKTASDKKIASIAAEAAKLKTTLAEVQKNKKDKENDGQRYIKEARDDLQKICKVLLQKKIENEDLLAEKEAIIQEIELLKQTSDQCKDKCQAKRNSIEEEIKKMNQGIADYKFQCIQCHQCIDTSDARIHCSDCPKCKEQRECLTQGDHCERDTTYDCVCMGVKEKFLNNVFENMYTVIERQTKTKPGKALADSIVKCLKNSRNGKLNIETRRHVQEFVLNIVRKNLNLTIAGGAVKTRCEMDEETYNQLMLCLKQVKVEKPPKEDKGTVPKKESCRHWGSTNECNCPGGAKACACDKRAPLPPKDPSPCPPVKEVPEPPLILCPHKDSAPKESVGCGSDCTMLPTGASVKSSKACETSECPFKKNMRAAQCVLGPESLSSQLKTHVPSTQYTPPKTPDIRVNSRVPVIPSTSKKGGTKSRDKVIEEVMGRYIDVTPIERVRLFEVDEQSIEINSSKFKQDNVKSSSKCLISNAPKYEHFQISNCSSGTLTLKDTDALLSILRKKKLTHICKTVWSGTNKGRALKLLSRLENTVFNDAGVRVQVILHPKFQPDKTKCSQASRLPLCGSTSSNSKRHKNKCPRRVREQNYPENSAGSKKTANDVRGLVKDVMVSDNIDDNVGSNIKWINVDSLIKLMSSESDVRESNNCDKTTSLKNK